MTTTADLLKRLELDKMYPPFISKLELSLNNLIGQGYNFWATSGYRSVEKQDGLYAQGRTKPGRIVTKAPGGFSAHNYGVGCDLALDANKDIDGLQPDWSEKNLTILAKECVKNGLEAGLFWVNIKDGPHIQLPLKSKGITWKTLLQVYRKDSLNGVWSYLDNFSW